MSEPRPVLTWLTDMDGVLVREEEPIPGAAEFIGALLEAERPFLVLTNNSIYTPRDLRARLLISGIDVPEANIWTSAMATADFLADQRPDGTAYVVGEAGLTTALHDVGYVMTEREPDYVVLGETRTYSFEAITRAIRLVEGGARFIATNPDVSGPSTQGTLPATGAVAALITAATGRRPYYVGKPNPLMMRSALNRLEGNSETTVMVGDRMDTDVKSGLEAGLRTVLSAPVRPGTAWSTPSPTAPPGWSTPSPTWSCSPSSRTPCSSRRTRPPPPRGPPPVLHLDDRWIWDSWIADDGERYHLFYLQAPRSLGDAGSARSASVGHAVSDDLVDWEVLPDALGPTPGAWDDVAIWTGSVVRGDDGLWRMFYTAINSRGHGLRDQQVGLATSPDLTTWTKVGDGPLLTADPRWYKTLDEDPGASETWRDPQVLRDPDGDGWHMLISARGLDHGRNDDGVIAHARSADLEHWGARPASWCESGVGFGQLEVLQVREIDGAWVLVFTCHPQEMTDERRAVSGDFCTWSCPAGPRWGRGTSAWPLRSPPSPTCSPHRWCSAATAAGRWSASATSSRGACWPSRSSTPSASGSREGVLVADPAYDAAANPTPTPPPLEGGAHGESGVVSDP